VSDTEDWKGARVRVTADPHYTFQGEKRANRDARLGDTGTVVSRGPDPDGDLAVRLDDPHSTETPLAVECLTLADRRRISDSAAMDTLAAEWRKRTETQDWPGADAGDLIRDLLTDTGRLAVETPNPRHELRRCEARARRGTGTGVCAAPLDDRGYCPRGSSHLKDPQ
jgi:hypothetical protein